MKRVLSALQAATNWRYLVLIVVIWIATTAAISLLPESLSGAGYALLRVALYLLLVPVVDNFLFGKFDTDVEIHGGNTAYAIMLSSVYIGLAMLIYAL